MSYCTKNGFVGNDIRLTTSKYKSGVKISWFFIISFVFSADKGIS